MKHQLQKRRKRELPVTKDANSDILQGFEILGIKTSAQPEYPGTQNFAKRFVRCSRTKFTQVTYSASSS